MAVTWVVAAVVAARGVDMGGGGAQKEFEKARVVGNYPDVKLHRLSNVLA